MIAIKNDCALKSPFFACPVFFIHAVPLSIKRLPPTALPSWVTRVL